MNIYRISIYALFLCFLHYITKDVLKHLNSLTYSGYDTVLSHYISPEIPCYRSSGINFLCSAHNVFVNVSIHSTNYTVFLGEYQYFAEINELLREYPIGGNIEVLYDEEKCFLAKYKWMLLVYYFCLVLLMFAFKLFINEIFTRFKIKTHPFELF